MQTVLAGAATGASLLGLIYAWLARRATKQASGWSRLLRDGWGLAPAFGASAALLAFLFTLPYKPPWSPGLLMGFGILIGALCALLAVGEAATDPAGDAWAGRCAGLLSLAALGPSLILILFRGDPSDAVIGCALGGVIVAIGCIGMLAPAAAAGASSAGALCRGIESYILSAGAVAAGSYLALARYPRATPFADAGGYWSIPGLLTAIAALVLILVAVGNGAKLAPARLLITGIACALAIALAAGLIRWKLLPQLTWTPLVYATVGFGLMAFLFQREDAASGDYPGRPAMPALVTALAALLVGALAFQAAGGYGQALALVAAGVIVLLVHGGRPTAQGSMAGAMVSGGAALLLLLTWYRLYSDEFEQWRSLDFQQHYQFLAVALGAGAVFALLSHVANGSARWKSRPGLQSAQAFAVTGLGLMAVAAPVFIAALWGGRATAAFIGGLVVSEVVWMLVVAWSTAEERLIAIMSSPHVFLLGSALIAAHITPIAVNLDLTRAQKVYAIAVLAVIVLVVYVAGKLRGMSDETPA
ncbi:MAG TPA: hypothetical protein VGM51_19345 [Armatimonadota bacterium]|jgi:hypothetical protein